MDIDSHGTRSSNMAMEDVPDPDEDDLDDLDGWSRPLVSQHYIFADGCFRDAR